MNRKLATVADLKAAEASTGLGGIHRECNQCHADWRLGQAACPKCWSHIFDETVIAPTPFEFGPLNKIRQVLQPDKPKAPQLAPEDAVILRHAAALGHAYIEALAEADVVSRRMVNTGVGTRETAGYMQDRINAVANTVGDTTVANLKPFVLSIGVLSKLIEDTVLELEKENSR